MKNNFFPSTLFPLVIAGTLLASGCNSKPNDATQPAPTAAAPTAAAPDSSMAQQPAAQQAAPVAAPSSAMAPAPPPQPVTYTIPAGTRISVSMAQEINSKTATEGQPFSATVVRDVIAGGKVVIKNGASASGTVVATKSRGRFKGAGYLELSLDAVRADGRTYPVSTENVERVEKGKGKRTAGFVGGGSGLGAIIGGIAGGGKGALIGGLAGAGAGTAGTAFTDNKPIVIPAETVLTFRLDKSVTVR